jgi:hypothetical protein
MKPVVQRHQNSDDNPIAHEVSQYDLKIAETICSYLTRHRNESKAGKGRPDHPESHEKPGGLTICCEKCVGIGSSRGNVGDPDQHSEVNDQDNRYQDWAHRSSFGFISKESVNLNKSKSLSPVPVHV